MNSEFELQPGAVPFPGFGLHLPLGRGGCGEVWEARGPAGQALAFKFMRCRNTAAATKEVRSFQAIGKLRHSHLLRVHEVFLLSGYVVISMELADGSLMDVFDAYQDQFGTALPPDLVCDYLGQAADAIDFLNNQRHLHEGRRVGFQHCDVKPSNLLLCGETVKLADFGLATSLTSALEPHCRSGSLDFAAPEVFRGQISDRTDQYALAVTYCVLRTGRFPFRDTPKSFTPIYSRGQPDLSLLTQAERTIISKALSISPIQRWPSCGTFLSHLQDLSHATIA